ncbi:MAG TPA: hypothetical protein VHZ52_17310 [Acidobacteriaceae bacterium]|nr:hypothetical protein [Acidobacteriaceae bacterium]
MKGKFLLSAFALLAPMTLAAQVTKPTTNDAPAPFYRYEVFAGVDYMGANQVKSSSALIGGNGGVSAKLRKWFGATVDFGDYPTSATSYGLVKPTVTTFMAGPEFYIPADNLTGFFHVLMGGQHTGNAGVKPDISFAYAYGGGFEYMLTKRLALRITGDAILSASVQDPDNQGLSPHTKSDARASAGVAYHF